MHCLPCENWEGETAKSSRAIGVCCAMTIPVLSTTGVLEEWEGGRQAKVGETARPWLQHLGALRPDLSIEAMIKIKMEALETEVMGPLWTPFEVTIQNPNSGNGPVFYLKIA